MRYEQTVELGAAFKPLSRKMREHSYDGLNICGQLQSGHTAERSDEAKPNNNHRLITKYEHPVKKFIGCWW